MVTKLFALVAIVCLAVGLQILVFIFGWGLTPVSWWWIIGGGVVGFTLLRSLSDYITKE